MPSSACFADSPHLHSFPTRRSSDLTPNILRYMPRFSILDLAAVRTGGTIAEAYRNTVDLAQHADGWGFTRFWLAEHHNMPGIASAADRKSTRLNSSHANISYAVFCLFRRLPTSTLFPYTTLFRSYAKHPKIYAAIFNPRSSSCPHRWNDCGSVSEYSRPRAARGRMGIHALLAGRTP